MNKILVIDDDKSIRGLITEEMKHQRYDISKVIYAFDGNEGMEKYIKFRPEFVFLDMQMPGINGFETFKRIKDFDSDANVFLMTGYGVENETADAIKLGLKGYISKNDNYIIMVVSLIIAMLKMEG